MADSQLHPAFQKLIGVWHMDGNSAVRIENAVTADGAGLIVTVFEADEGGVESVSFYEYIAHDKANDTFFALACAQGNVMRGIGKQLADGSLRFEDINAAGELCLEVCFHFEPSAYRINATDGEGKDIFSFRYTKS